MDVLYESEGKMQMSCERKKYSKTRSFKSFLEWWIVIFFSKNTNPRKKKYSKSRSSRQKIHFEVNLLKSKWSRNKFFNEEIRSFSPKKLVEMAGTAPACTEVLSSCIPVYDSFLDTFFYKKMTKSGKKLISCTHFPTRWRILRSETDDTTLPYQFQEMKVVAGHTALIH